MLEDSEGVVIFVALVIFGEGSIYSSAKHVQPVSRFVGTWMIGGQWLVVSEREMAVAGGGTGSARRARGWTGAGVRGRMAKAGLGLPVGGVSDMARGLRDGRWLPFRS